jgi:HD-GYP domain-containing protein (c-di-GMP phosphodiesterase class II)
VIAAVLRSEDVSARIGGDEFAVLLRGAGAPAATAVAQRAREIVRERGIGIGMSFGVGTWPVDGRSTNLLLLRADTAMYAAKSAGAIKRQHDVDVSGALSRRSPPDVQRDARDPDQREQLLAYARDVRTSHARELRRSQELNDSYLATVRTLAAAVEAKDDYTGCHIQRVHGLGLLLAQTVIPQQASDPQLSYGLLLHDMWARMFAVVDTVDAITSDRPYRQARPLDVALTELVEGSGSQFDPACVQAFLRIDRRLIELLLEQQGTAIPCISELVLPEYALSDPG